MSGQDTDSSVPPASVPSPRTSEVRARLHLSPFQTSTRGALVPENERYRSPTAVHAVGLAHETPKSRSEPGTSPSRWIIQSVLAQADDAATSIEMTRAEPARALMPMALDNTRRPYLSSCHEVACPRAPRTVNRDGALAATGSRKDLLPGSAPTCGEGDLP